MARNATKPGGSDGGTTLRSPVVRTAVARRSYTGASTLKLYTYADESAVACLRASTVPTPRTAASAKAKPRVHAWEGCAIVGPETAYRTGRAGLVRLERCAPRANREY